MSGREGRVGSSLMVKAGFVRRVISGLLALVFLWAACMPARAVETVVYYHNDALGSPVAATDESGQVLWREAYAPYGSRLLREDFGANAIWYTGKPEESEFELTYLGARWYAPGTGRFLSTDPAGFDEENFLSFNRYAYGNDNPYAFIDPDGRESIDVQFAGMDGGRATRGEILFAAGITAAPLLLHPGIAAFVVKEAISEATGVDAVSVKGLGKSIARAAKNVPKGSSSGLRPLESQRGAVGDLGRHKNFFRELREAEGRPHTVFRRNPTTGRIENYQTFDRAGFAGGNKRFRGTGKSHGGVEPPLVLTPRSGRPGGRPSRARPARPDELPNGF